MLFLQILMRYSRFKHLKVLHKVRTESTRTNLQWCQMKILNSSSLHLQGLIYYDSYNSVFALLKCRTCILPFGSGLLSLVCVVLSKFLWLAVESF